MMVRYSPGSPLPGSPFSGNHPQSVSLRPPASDVGATAIRVEELVGLEREPDGLAFHAGDVQFIVKVGDGIGGVGRLAKYVMIGDQQSWADQKTRRIADQIRARISELDAADRTRHERALGQVIDAVEIVAIDDPLEADLSGLGIFGLLKKLTLTKQLLLRRHMYRAVTKFPIQLGG